MKKAKYILIVTLIMMLLSPAFIVQAQSPPGYCLDKNANLLIEGKTSEARCIEVNGILITSEASCNLRENLITLGGCRALLNALDQASAKAEIKNKASYELLTPLPCNRGTAGCPEGEFSTFDPEQGLGAYLNIMIRIFIGVCAVLAMAMIILGGLEYMTSELISSKESGKKKITGAVFGLILALGSYAILNTINPDLLDTNVNIKEAVVRVEFEPEVGIEAETITLRSSQGDVTLRACDESQMVPINLFGKHILVYKGVVKELEKVNRIWLATPLTERYEVTSLGGYNCRRVASNPNHYSAHAFGLAIDVNPTENPYGSTRITNLPASFIEAFRDENWGWGGLWESVKDPMHFSKFPPAEGGDGTVDF